VEQFLNGLRDSREVYYRGERVPDVMEHPELELVAKHVAIDFELAEDSEYAHLTRRLADGEVCSAYYHVPRNAQDLEARSQLIELATREGCTLVVLVKEIGTDALLALRHVLAANGSETERARLEAFYKRCRHEDLALAVAQTDVKGDRGKRPSEQSDPDLYVRVVAERADGIVVRGAKLHTSYAPCVDEILVLPSRTMDESEAAWSLAFAVPVATPGLRLYTSDFLHGRDDTWTRPISSRHKMVETLTVFDDVFVPWDRVFLRDSPKMATAAALTFVEFHRFTAVSYKLPLLDALVGSAIAVARANGIDRASHVREKLTWLIGYSETVRALTQLAAQRCSIEYGVARPDVFTTNLAKWTFARDFHQAIDVVQDLAGGLLVTGPSGKDWDSPLIRPVLEKYLGGAWPAAARMAIINCISDLTTRQYGGYQAVLAIHAEGSLEAEKMAMLRAYDPARALGFALALAGLPID
jgi:aromatic ring hydroxylase